MTLKVKLGKNQPLPKYQTRGAAGFDLCATEDAILGDGVMMMDLDIAVQIPFGYYGKLVVRSSMAKRGVMLANQVGIVDSDYRGNIHAPLIAHKEPVIVAKGERIVQLLIVPVEQFVIEEVDELADTERGMGGFGSTNK